MPGKPADHELRMEKFAELVLFQNKTQAEAYEEAFGKLKSKQAAANMGNKKMKELKASDMFESLKGLALKAYRDTLETGSETNKIKVAKDIFDRVDGTPTQKVDHTSGGEKIQGFPMYLPKQDGQEGMET